jgi:hypothetical protein
MSWTNAANFSVQVAVVLVAGAAGVSVTQADTTPEDGVQQSFTTANMTGPISAASLGGKDILALLSDTDPTTATTYVLDVSAVIGIEGMPRIGDTSTLSVTGGEAPATQDVVIGPASGWAFTKLAGTLDKTAGGFLALMEAAMGVTIVVGDIIYYNNGRGEIVSATGVYTGGSTIPYEGTSFLLQQGGSATSTATTQDGIFYPFGKDASGNGIPIVILIARNPQAEVIEIVNLTTQPPTIH